MKLYQHPCVWLPVVGSEPAPAVPLAVPEVEVRVPPRRLRRLHLERVVVVTLIILELISIKGKGTLYVSNLEHNACNNKCLKIFIN